MRNFALTITFFGAHLTASCSPIIAPENPPPQSVAPEPVTDASTPQVLAAEDIPYNAVPISENAVPTKILDRDDLARLMNNSGITLQWIDWNKRGRLKAGNRDGEIWLSGAQYTGEGENGALTLDGRVVEIGTDYFTFSGTITIVGAPDKDRVCNLTRDDWRFEVTQNRKYWRLRQFEWCDGLTDYVDIYF